MPSKKSCFNVTLFKKHLSRFWPLWGGVSLVGSMFPLAVLLALVQRETALTTSSEFAEGLYQIAAYFVPGFTCAYAVFCALAVWGYLYNARSVGMMHTLPVDRTCLFVTNTLAGLAMTVIPYAVVGGMVCLIALGWGFFHLTAVVQTVLAVVFCVLLFFGMATVCAMLTGHGVVLPVFYLLANFLVFLMEILVANLAHEFLVGVPMREDMGRLSFLSPIPQIYNSFTCYSEYLPESGRVTHLRGLWVVALYALAGCALLALAWLLYKRRHSESAGDVVAFRWLRPIFRYGVALLGGLTIGRLLYELLWAEIFQKGMYADALPMAVCIFLGGLLGYYAASMLLEKSLRVFRGSLRGIGIVAAGAAAVCLLVSVDVFGLERKIPAWDEIESVTLVDRGISSGPYATEKNPDQAAALMELHRAIVEDRDFIRGYTYDWVHAESARNRVSSHYIHLSYRLKDGSLLERQYDLWLTEDRAETPGTYDNLLAEFYNDPVVRAGDVTIPEGADLDTISICCDYTDWFYQDVKDHADGSNREVLQLYAALQKDAQEGNIPSKDVMQYYNGIGRSFYMQLEYRIFDTYSNGYYGECKTVYPSPSMTNTIQTLIDLEYLTEEDVAQWERDLAENAKLAETATHEDAVWAEAAIVYPG